MGAWTQRLENMITSNVDSILFICFPLNVDSGSLANKVDSSKQEIADACVLHEFCNYRVISNFLLLWLPK